MFKYYMFVLAFFLIACNNNDKQQQPATNPGLQTKSYAFPVKDLVIDNGAEEGWGADIKLSIVSVKEDDTTRNLTAVSNYNGKNLGLMVSVPKAKEGNNGFAKGLILKSIGSESDYLISTLANLYHQETDTTLRFNDNISVPYVNLNEFAKRVGGNIGAQGTTTTMYKLFFEDENGNYAELYLNINDSEHWIEIREKDEEYRPTIIKFLKQ